MGLIDSLNLTSLDLENPGPLERIIRSTPIPNYVPSTATGTPSIDGIPGPFNAFYQKYIFGETYLNSNPIRGNGVLINTLEATGLDKDTPYNPSTDSTSYPATNTGTPTSKANPGAPSKFSQAYTPDNTYLSAVGEGKLISSVDKTNFDVEDSGVDGGIPYKQDKDPTVYPKRVTGFPISSRFNNGLAVFPGSPEKFYQEYNPSREYIDEVGNGVLDLLFENTDLDTETNRVDGSFLYKLDKDPTIYPRFSTRGLKEASKFFQTYSSVKIYLDDVTKFKSKLFTTFDQTNLDLRSPSPNGGVPYRQYLDPTRYPITSTGKFLARYPNGKQSTAATLFYQFYYPGITYLDFIKNRTGKSALIHLGDESVQDPATGLLTKKTYSIFDVTNLDTEKPGVDGGIPYKRDKDPTVYPIFTKGRPAPDGGFIQSKFYQIWSPQIQYLRVQNIISGEGYLQTLFNSTNLDLENEKPNGGLPYKQGSDPTVYPVRTQASSPSPGFFATQGKAAAKFNPKFSPKNTYLDSIGA